MTTEPTAGPAALSVVLPAYNEEDMLGGTVRQLHRALGQLGLRAEIIIVDDGSRDRTGHEADALAAELPGVSARHQANQGIGGAFRAGAEAATGDYIMLWPADMPAAAADVRPYAERLGAADVIVGCRRRRAGYNPLMALNSWVYPRLVGLLFGLRLRDVNWIHAYRRAAFMRISLTQRGIPMLVEALVKLRDSGATFVEIDVEMRKRERGVASASRPIVMWRTLAGLLSFWIAWRVQPRPPRHTTSA
ncbi:MAG TPA: glycosyltransferase family 2 protein [Opitutaceae bacterium]